MSADASNTPPSRLHECDRGAASVEYLVVLTVVALSLAVTLVTLGPQLVQSWSESRAVLYGPSP